VNRARIEIAKPEVVRYFLTLQKKVFSYQDVEDILSKERDNWKLAKSMSGLKFLEFLLKESILKEVRLKFPHRPTKRFISDGASVLEIASSLRQKGYFSHYSAIQIHGLSKETSKIIYINEEQNNDNSNNEGLRQDRIDAAFQRPARVSNNKATIGDTVICILNGMNTGGLGVESSTINGIPIRATNVERTLIDAAVRPVYSGGIHGVLEAYNLAHDKFSPTKLIQIYRTIKYSYPYHQAIGFYMEAVGKYALNSIESLLIMPKKFDFYLTHQMEDTKYSKKWRIYYPSYINELLPEAVKQ